LKALATVLLLPLMATTAGSAAVSELNHRWQGAWVVRDTEYPGSVQAWNVHGSSIEVYDPAARRTQEQHFRIQSPCSVVRTQSLGGGEETSTTSTFAFAADGLHVASGDEAGGLRQGPLLTACIGDHVYPTTRAASAAKSWTLDERLAPSGRGMRGQHNPAFLRSPTTRGAGGRPPDFLGQRPIVVRTGLD
jgi:hypothetical protein